MFKLSDVLSAGQQPHLYQENDGLKTSKKCSTRRKLRQKLRLFLQPT
jgi:hypothetical protein